jgi:hypothetical protein
VWRAKRRERALFLAAQSDGRFFQPFPECDCPGKHIDRAIFLRKMRDSRYIAAGSIFWRFFMEKGGNMRAGEGDGGMGANINEKPVDWHGVLWVLLVSLQTFVCLYLINDPAFFYRLEHAAFPVVLFYRRLGFDWHSQTALIWVCCFLFSLTMNAFMRIANVVLSRRTLYEFEDRNIPLSKCWLRLAIYSLLFVFFVGVWGSGDPVIISMDALDDSMGLLGIFMVSLIVFSISNIIVESLGFIVFVCVLRLGRHGRIT